MFGLSGIKLAIYAGIGFLLYCVFSWGFEIIEDYNRNIAKITKLERDAALREARLATKQTVIERQRAAIDASKCKAQIDKFLKNPDLLKPVNPFNPNIGG